MRYDDAVTVAVTYMESLHHKEPAKLQAEWRRLAEAYGIELEEDPDLVEQRIREAHARLEAMLGPLPT